MRAPARPIIDLPAQAAVMWIEISQRWRQPDRRNDMLPRKLTLYAAAGLLSSAAVFGAVASVGASRSMTTTALASPASVRFAKPLAAGLSFIVPRPSMRMTQPFSVGATLSAVDVGMARLL